MRKRITRFICSLLVAALFFDFLVPLTPVRATEQVEYSDSADNVSEPTEPAETIVPTEATEPSEATEPVEPTEPASGSSSAPATGTAYKLLMNQANTGSILYFNGQTESATVTYRLATTENAEEAVQVFVEETTGGYYLYFNNEAGEKVYIRVYERNAEAGKGSLELVTEAPAEVLVYDSAFDTLIYTGASGNSYYMGTYNTYTTFSVSNISYLSVDNMDVTQFPARLSQPAHEHSFVYAFDNNATFTEDGTQTGYCSCGLTDTQPAPGSMLTRMEVDTLPNTVYWALNGTMPLTGLVLRVYSQNGESFLQPLCDEITAEADLTSVGRKTATVFFRGGSAVFDIYVHAHDSTLVPADRYPESSHSYGNSISETQYFCWPGAASLTVTFSASTFVENSFDFISVYDAEGNLLAKYTGAAAAGQTLQIPGDSFQVTLQSDHSVTNYGYSFSSIVANDTPVHSPVEIPGTEATCTQTGLSAASICGICDLTLTEATVLPALGHQVTKGNYNNDATWWENGTQTGICDRCGDTATVTAPGTMLPSQYTGTCGSNLRWAFIDGNILILDGQGAMTDDYYYSVTHQPWYYFRQSIEKVIINPGVTSIGYNAFADCTNLTSIEIPDTVTQIGFFAFKDCSSLVSVSLPEGVTTIGESAFYGCSSLICATLGSSLTELYPYAFKGCSSLPQILLPHTLTDIPTGAFQNCSSLKAVSFGSSVNAIGGSCFLGCTSLADVYFSGNSSQWASISIGTSNEPLLSATLHKNHTHDYSLFSTVTVAATCQEAGYVEYTCIYGETMRLHTPALGHDAGQVKSVVAPTCDSDGYNLCSCNRCGQDVAVVTAAALGHLYSDTELLIQARSCEQQGIWGYPCLRCDAYTVTATEDEYGHSVVFVPAAEASCTEAGHTAGTQCVRCLSWFVEPRQTAPATGHNRTEYVSNGDATCEADGTKTAICLLCGLPDTVTDPGSATGIHSFTNYVSNGDATFEADGTKTAKCDHCDATDTVTDQGSMLQCSILKHPQSVTVDSGNTVYFSVETLGEVVSYQWQYRKVWKWFDTAMEGYNTDTLTVDATGTRNSYDYRCIITFANGTVLTSELAELTVNTRLDINSHPSDQVVALGVKGQFSAEATGEVVKYQWEYKRPNGTVWMETSMEGATQATVYIETTTARNGYQYRCRLSDITGKVVYTNPATLRVLSITGQPLSQNAYVGETAQFTLTTNVAEGFTYQWQYRRSETGAWSNTTMAGYNTATLSVDATLARNGYQYRCVLTGAKNSKVYSEPATLYVYEPAPDPVWVLAWVVEPMYDSVNAVSARTPDADGYYYVELSVAGVTKVYKTRTADGIDYVDMSGFKKRAVSICLTDKDSLEFTMALGATNHSGATGAKVTTITAIEDGIITGTDVAYTGMLAAGSMVFDVSEEAAVAGQLTTLRVGDYARIYTDSDGNALYTYVFTRTSSKSIYEQAKAMDFSAGGTVIARCPVCNSNASWVPLEANTSGKSLALTAGHYYLSENIDYTANNYLYSFTAQQTLCLNLNGQNLTSTQRVFYTEKLGTVLNVMGEGTVTGVGYYASIAGKWFGAMDLTTDANFYGGTYISTGEGPAIGNRKTSSGDALVSIYEGTIVKNENANAMALYALKSGSLAINGGTVIGQVLDSDSKGITVSGAPIVDYLDLTGGKLLTVGALTEGASITVDADGVFTEDLTDANAVKDYFHSRLTGGEIVVEGAALAMNVESIEPGTEPTEPEISVYEQAKAMDFSAGGTITALCPVCGTKEQWSEMPAPTSSSKNTLPTGHYYVAEDMNVTKFWYITSSVLCVNLNGKNITNEADRVLYAEGADTVINIMGDGVVTGTGKYNSSNANFVGAALDVVTTVNLYGGSWKSTSEYPAISLRGTQAYSTLSIYEGTEIVRTAEDTQGLNLYICENSTVNMYDGIISGGTAIEHPALTTGKVGGNVMLKVNLREDRNHDYDCSFNLYGGCVENGTAEVTGGNIAAVGNNIENPSAAINLCGGQVLNGSVCAIGANASVTVSGDPIVDYLDLTGGKLLTVGALTEGASITVDADGVFTEANEHAATYVSAGYIKAVEGKTITVTDNVMSMVATLAEKILRFFKLR